MLRPRYTAIAALALLLAGHCHARDRWDWYLATAAYQRLTAHERAEYRRAKELLSSAQYRAAAAVFDKFIAQFPESDALPYMIFLRGYSLHQAKDRFTAIKSYNEVLDYFGDVIDSAAPALYFLGTARLANGDERQGLAALKEMVEDEDYRQHPLAAGALRRLADNHLKNKEPAKAVRYWRQVHDDFTKSNRREASEALSSLIRYAVDTGTYDELMAWWVVPERADKAAYRRSVADRVWNSVWWYLHRQGSKYADKKQGFAEFFGTQKTWYEQAGVHWEFYSRDLRFRARHRLDETAMRERVDEASRYVATLEDPETRDSRFGQLAEWLREAGQYDRARFVAGKIGQPAQSRFSQAAILKSEGRFKEAGTLYEEIEGMGEDGAVRRAKEARGHLYREQLGRYEEAIALYRELADPPRSLWWIADCYLRWKKLPDAIQSYTEIENSFPNEAAKAAWYRAYHYDRAGNKKMAIAAARRVLKMYPESQESSSAHQLLEKHGIRTGGGVLE